MPHSKLHAIGKILREEEDRFIGYPEIEGKTKELGFGISVRTLRFYVDEGILPPPRKVGKTPVYEEEWILNILLSLHLMKTRFNRSLTEIRTVLGRLQEDPAVLADKLSVLYEEYLRGETLKPLERSGLVDAVFDLLSGRLGGGLQASELRLTDLAEAVTRGGRWDGDRWVAPPTAQLLASQGLPRAESADPDDEDDDVDGDETSDEDQAADPAAGRPASGASAPAEPLVPPPEGAVTLERARGLEEVFVQRFEANFDLLGRVHCPLDGKGYKAGPRERNLLKRDRSGKVVELMKRSRVYDRSLLDRMPRDEAREFQVHQRGLFGRGELKVVVAALVLSPMEEFLTRRWAREPLGPLDAQRALESFTFRDGVFYYVGMLSTVGWSPEARDQVPGQRNLLVTLVENLRGTAWKRHLVLDPRWAGMERLYDPETDREKVDRVRDRMAGALKPKGEFLILRNVAEDLDVPLECVQAAVDELLSQDPQLELLESNGRPIIKRRRL